MRLSDTRGGFVDEDEAVLAKTRDTAEIISAIISAFSAVNVGVEADAEGADDGDDNDDDDDGHGYGYDYGYDHVHDEHGNYGHGARFLDSDAAQSLSYPSHRVRDQSQQHPQRSQSPSSDLGPPSRSLQDITPHLEAEGSHVNALATSLSPSDLTFPEAHDRTSAYTRYLADCTPATPPALRYSIVPSTGFGMDYGAYRAPTVEAGHDDITRPDAPAIAPVIRMGKSRSSMSLPTRIPTSSATPTSTPASNAGMSASAGATTRRSMLANRQQPTGGEGHSLSQRPSRTSLASSLSTRSFRSFRLSKKNSTTQLQTHVQLHAQMQPPAQSPAPTHIPRLTPHQPQSQPSPRSQSQYHFETQVQDEPHLPDPQLLSPRDGRLETASTSSMQTERGTGTSVSSMSEDDTVVASRGPPWQQDSRLPRRRRQQTSLPRPSASRLPHPSHDVSPSASLVQHGLAIRLPAPCEAGRSTSSPRRRARSRLSCFSFAEGNDDDVAMTGYPQYSPRPAPVIVDTRAGGHWRCSSRSSNNSTNSSSNSSSTGVGAGSDLYRLYYRSNGSIRIPAQHAINTTRRPRSNTIPTKRTRDLVSPEHPRNSQEGDAMETCSGDRNGPATTLATRVSTVQNSNGTSDWLEIRCGQTTAPTSTPTSGSDSTAPAVTVSTSTQHHHETNGPDDDMDAAPAPTVSTRLARYSSSPSATTHSNCGRRQPSQRRSNSRKRLSTIMSSKTLGLSGLRSPHAAAESGEKRRPVSAFVTPVVVNNETTARPQSERRPSAPADSMLTSPAAAQRPAFASPTGTTTTTAAAGSIQCTDTDATMHEGTRAPSNHSCHCQSRSQPASHENASMRRSSIDSIDIAIGDFLSAPRLNQTVLHPADNRSIAFSEVGDPHGQPVFICLGMGLTRYVSAFYDDLARALKLRLITPDRPGIGGSEVNDEGRVTPLAWPDDIAIICNHLKIIRFSILAHSAGAIYALAAAMRMPQHIRGRIHLLAPWIPPSQIEMSNIAISNVQRNPSSASQSGSDTRNGSTSSPPELMRTRSLAMPYSQRILKVLPTPIFKVANAGFMNVTSGSMPVPASARSTSRMRRRWRNSSSSRSATPHPCNHASCCGGSGGGGRASVRSSLVSPPLSPQLDRTSQETCTDEDHHDRHHHHHHHPHTECTHDGDCTPGHNQASPVSPAELDRDREREREREREHSADHDARLASAIWDAATRNANPSVDLLVCLERHQPIGFRYADVTHPCIVHHGARDSRVPVENVRWLGRTMPRCEVRVLDDEGHALMARASVMSEILMSIAEECGVWKVRGSDQDQDQDQGREQEQEQEHSPTSDQEMLSPSPARSQPAPGASADQAVTIATAVAAA